MPKTNRSVAVLCAAAFAAALLHAHAATPSRKDFGQISQLVLNSYNLIVKDKDMAAARVECEKAREMSQRFKDPFILATVEVCFGDVDDYENKPKSACQHFDAALKLFKSTPEKHPARRSLNNQIKALEGKRFQLSC